MEWKVEIPVINLSAQIANGTDEEIMNKYVGHFEETVNIIGNVGLAAHNRGYPVNYFKNLKDLKLEDEIYYTYLGKKRKYKIDKIEVIQDTNWKPLENTKQNRITLITCIANKPEYRLCIQALELGGKNENKKNIYIISHNGNDGKFTDIIKHKYGGRKQTDFNNKERN